MVKKVGAVAELIVLVKNIVVVVQAILKKKWIPVYGLAAAHAVEFFAFGRKTGKDEGFSLAESIVNTLMFGFTWWLPLKLKDKIK